MEEQLLDALFQAADAFLTVTIMAAVLWLFMQGKLQSSKVVEAERKRDEDADERLLALHVQLNVEKDKRIEDLERQCADKDSRLASFLTMMQAYQGAQDVAAHTAKALLGESDE